MVSLANKLVTDYDEAPCGHIKPKRDESRKMHVLEWHGKESMKVGEVGIPLVTDPDDAILKVTSTCICGSDLHMYEGVMPGMKSGDITGHEFMGIIEDVGSNVKSLKKGDRVVAAFDIGCGKCFFCKHGDFSGCDRTNPSKDQEMLYGHHTSGMFGYSHLTGGWPGGQAEFARVPCAETNLLKLPQDLNEDDAVLLSDILPTAWHANELAKVEEGNTVAIWGAGPVGILAAQCAFARGASRVVIIDEQPYRLEFAKSKIPKLETINFQEKKVVDTLHEMFPESVGPDCCIEAVGFHYTKTWLHWIETALKLETDPSEMLNEIIYSCRKGGRIGVVGVYAGFTNHFNIGAFMEKGQTMGAGQTPVQKYWHQLLEMVQSGKLKPSVVVTHHLPLDEGPRGYKMFNAKEENCIKVILKPGMRSSSTAAEQ
jgi:threonine dehydrogenase-like Zn-dependent dehydrogenase